MLYEQLEQKLEESQESSRQLGKLHKTSHALLENKSSSLGDLEKELTKVKQERADLRAELHKLREDDVGEWSQLKIRKTPEKDITPVRQVFFGDDSVDDGTKPTENEELVRLKSTVRELSAKLQSSISQKRLMERDMDDLLGDNAGLSQNLEKMEGDISTLQLRLEEAQERNMHMLDVREGMEVEDTLPTLLDPCCHHSTAVKMDDDDPMVLMNAQDSGHADSMALPTPPTPPSNTNTAPELTPVPDIKETTNGQSIFSELDREYSSLQQQYQDLLTNCNCSASQPQQVEEEGGGDGETAKSICSGTKKPVSGSIMGSTAGGSAFKELFDELFATLKQTAQVADRLIEGNGN